MLKLKAMDARGCRLIMAATPEFIYSAFFLFSYCQIEVPGSVCVYVCVCVCMCVCKKKIGKQECVMCVCVRERQSSLQYTAEPVCKKKEEEEKKKRPLGCSY